MRLVEEGRGGGRLGSWRKERKERGGDRISAAFQDFSDHSAKLKYDCSLLHREGKKPFK